MSREHFEAVGRLFKCPNPRHDFTIGRIVGSWRWALDSWGYINERGNLVTKWAAIDKTETPDGLWVVGLTFWKFSITVGLVGR